MLNAKNLLEQTLGIPFTQGNTITILKNGREIFPAMLSAIKEAKHSIDFLTFVYWEGTIADTFAQALSKKANEGVSVRVLLDAYGALPMNKRLIEQMRSAGVAVVWFRPLVRWKVWKVDNRTHRKILVCDHSVAFTGGVGIAEEWEGNARNDREWRDTHFKIEGEAVAGIKAAFIENWIEATHSLEAHSPHQKPIPPQGYSSIQVISTSASVRWSNIVLLYQALLRMATQRIYLCTAYFNPDEELLRLLVEKANNGIDVQLITAGKHTDQRLAKLAAEDTFATLLKAGVAVHYYQKTMMHAKILLIDDELSCIGSANFNHRSMLKDDEINLVVLDEGINKTLTAHFMEDLEACTAIRESEWRNRSVVQRLQEAFTRLINQQI